MRTNKLFRKVINIFIKYTPIISAFFIFIYMLSIILVEIPVIYEELFLTGGLILFWILGLLLSIFSKYCIYHRMYYYYILAVGLYAIHHRHIRFFNEDVYASVFIGLSFIYLIIITILYKKHGNKHE